MLRKGKNEEVNYPTAGINGGSDGPIFQINEFPNFVNIRISSVREHRPSAGKSEPLPFVYYPILHRLLHRQGFMRRIQVPSVISTLRPWKRIPVPRRRRNTALQYLLLLRAVPLSVNQPVSCELQRPFRVLAWRVLAVLHAACREVIGFSGGGGGVWEGGAWGGAEEGDGGGGVLTEAEKVSEYAEEED